MSKPGNLAGGILPILAGMCLCPIGIVQLLAEGPHGPGGRITGDPGSGVRCLLFCGLSIAAIATGAWLVKSAVGKK